MFDVSKKNPRNSRKRLTIGEVLKHPWLNQPLPSPASPLSITSVLGTVSTNSPNNNNNSNNNDKDITKTSTCGVLTAFDATANAIESNDDLVKTVHCETPSTSSSVGSLEDAEIIDFTKIANASNDANSITNTKDDKVEDEKDRSAMETQVTVSVPQTDQVAMDEQRDVLAITESPSLTSSNNVPNTFNDQSSQIGHSRTAEQLVEVQDSSEDRYVNWYRCGPPAELPFNIGNTLYYTGNIFMLVAGV